MKLKKQGLYLITLIVFIWFAGQVLYPASLTLTHGFAAYYSAARLLKIGQFSAQVYEPAYFRPIVRADSHDQADDIYHANPPTTSLMFWPLSFLSIEKARVSWIIANAAMLFGGLALLTLTFAPQPDLPTFALLALLAMLFQPVLENIRLGQAYLLIFLLLTLVGVAGSKIGRLTPARWAISIGGLALALALIFKTAGWALLPLLAWQKRWQALAWVTGFVGLIGLLTLPLFPPSLWLAYGQLLRETSNSPAVCATAYQTTRSLLCHLFVFDSTWSPSPLAHLPWLASSLFVGLALISLGLNFRLAMPQPVWAFMATLAWGVIFAPLGEQYHHTVMLIPLSWLVIHWQSLNKASRITLMLAFCLYFLPLPPNTSSWQNGGWAWLAYLRVYGAGLALLSLYLLREPIPAPAPSPA
jgi:hypothetical protein